MKQKTAQQLVDDNLIVKHYAGSHAYGTSLPTSDTDFRGVFVGDPVNVRTPFFKIEEVDVATEEDTKIYELSQFMHLAVQCNPNVIETLWVDEQDIVYSHPAYQLMRDAAPKLLSSKIAFTTSGYALAQLKRIKGHNKWIMKPQPEAQPQPVDFVSMVQHFTKGDETPTMPRDFTLRNFNRGHRLIPFGRHIYGLYVMEGYSPYNEVTGALNEFFEDESRAGLGSPKYIIKFNHDEYVEANTRWSQYWDWKKNRNEKRSVLEEQHGYDTKHAMHLVRLLRMGAEALQEGKIHVRRPDAEELLAIRNGSWTYEQVVQYAEDMDKWVREELYQKTSLPKASDVHLAAKVVMDVQDMMWTDKSTLKIGRMTYNIVNKE